MATPKRPKLINFSIHRKIQSYSKYIFIKTSTILEEKQNHRQVRRYRQPNFLSPSNTKVFFFIHTAIFN